MSIFQNCYTNYDIRMNIQHNIRMVIMKKIIALLLAIVMVMSLAACGAKDDAPATEAPKVEAPVETPTEAPVVEEPPVTEAPEVETPDVANKQALYEKVFTEGTYTIKEGSMKVVMGDILTIDTMFDPEGKVYMAMSGSVEGGTMSSALYMVNDETMYAYNKVEMDGEFQETWLKCELTEDFNIEDGEVTSDEDVEALMENIKKIEYVETVDGLDHVILYTEAAAAEYVDDTEYTVHADIGFVLDGVECVMTYQEADWTSTSYDNVPEDFDSFDWDFDYEAMTMTNEETNEVLECYIIKDYLAEVEEEVVEDEGDNLVAVHVYLDPNGYQIQKIDATQDGMAMSFEIYDCANVADFVTLPENVDNLETIPAEEALMSFAMTMMAILLSQADMG